MNGVSDYYPRPVLSVRRLLSGSGPAGGPLNRSIINYEFIRQMDAEMGELMSCYDVHFRDLNVSLPPLSDREGPRRETVTCFGPV